MPRTTEPVSSDDDNDGTITVEGVVLTQLDVNLDAPYSIQAGFNDVTGEKADCEWPQLN